MANDIAADISCEMLHTVNSETDVNVSFLL